MSDPPKPPPLPNTPLRLVRPRRVADELLELQLDNQRLRNALEAERATVQILRQQYVERESGATDDTLPGIGAPRRHSRRVPERKPNREAQKRGETWLVACLLLGLAAGLASLRYPGLMSPIRLVLRSFR